MAQNHDQSRSQENRSPGKPVQKEGRKKAAGNLERPKLSCNRNFTSPTSNVECSYLDQRYEEVEVKFVQGSRGNALKKRRILQNFNMLLQANFDTGEQQQEDIFWQTNFLNLFLMLLINPCITFGVESKLFLGSISSFGNYGQMHKAHSQDKVRERHHSFSC